MTCSPAELVLVPFPYADLQTSKKRPVLVLTAPDRHGDFIALAVTTVQPLEHALELEPAALAKGALPRRSWVRLDKIFTLGQETVLRTFGEVTPAFLYRLLDGLCERIGYRTEARVMR
jgi:mRNA interferase MazF